MDSGTSLLAVPSDAIKAYLLAYHCGAALYPSPASLLLLFLYSLPSSISGPCSSFTYIPSVLYFRPSFPGPVIVLTRCRSGRPRDPSFTGRLSPTPPPSGGPSGLAATTCGAVSYPGWRGSFCSLPGVVGGGVCRYNGRRPKPRCSRGWYGSRGLTPPLYSVGCPWGATLGLDLGWISFDPWLRPCGLHYSAVSEVRFPAKPLPLTRLTPMPFRLTPIPVGDVPGFPVHRRNCPT